MLIGRFGNTSGRPYLEGRLVIPRLSIRGDISFLVDTGADKTVIMPIDAARLRVNHNRFKIESEMRGIGGTGINYPEQCLVAFTEAGKKAFVYDLTVLFAKPEKYNKTTPSILGRDIIDRWRMMYEKPKNRLTFTVISADATLRR